MITDAFLLLAGSISGNTVTGEDFKGTSNTVKGANVIDLLENSDIGEGEDLFLRVGVTVAAAGGTSVEFQAVVADDAALSTNPTVIGTTGAIPVADLTAGKQLAARLQPRIASLGQRYLGMQAVNVGANSAISAVADIGVEIQDGQKFYPSGFSVS